MPDRKSLKALAGAYGKAFGQFNVGGTAARRMAEATAPRKGVPNYGKKVKKKTNVTNGVEVIRGRGGKGGKRY